MLDRTDDDAPKAAYVIVVGNEKGGSGKSTIAVHVAVALHKYDFLVIDTPSADGYLTWLALGIADTLITPLNDSFVDFDALGNIDPVTYALIEPSKYAKMVRDERRARRQFDHSDIDWIVMRNRLRCIRAARTGSRKRSAIWGCSSAFAARAASSMKNPASTLRRAPNGLPSATRA